MDDENKTEPEEVVETDNPAVEVVEQALAPDDTTDAPVETEDTADDVVEDEPAHESRLVGLLGSDVPDETSEAGELLLNKLTKEDLDAELTPAAKVLLQTVRIESAKEVRAIRDSYAKKEAAFAAREAELAKGFKALRARQDDMDRLFRDPAFQNALKGPDGEAPKDPTSPEFVTHQVQKAVAERLGKALQPVAMQAQETQKRAAWDAIVEKYPDMADENSDLRKTAFALRNEDKEAGRATMDPLRYIQMAQGELARKKVEADRAAMAARRRDAARRIQKVSAPIAKSPLDEIPADVRKDPAALHVFLKNNPAARARIDAERRGG